MPVNFFLSAGEANKKRKETETSAFEIKCLGSPVASDIGKPAETAVTAADKTADTAENRDDETAVTVEKPERAKIDLSSDSESDSDLELWVGSKKTESDGETQIAPR